MPFLHLFIVNQSGGLIHHRPLSNRAPTIGTNDWLRIGSTFHSLHAIAAEASPVKLPNNKNASTYDMHDYCIYYDCIIVFCVQYHDSELTHSPIMLSVHHIHTILFYCTILYDDVLTATEFAEDGIEVIEGNGIILKCFQTRTGVKFVVT
jgi:hypothetical protein